MTVMGWLGYKTSAKNKKKKKKKKIKEDSSVNSNDLKWLNGKKYFVSSPDYYQWLLSIVLY